MEDGRRLRGELHSGSEDWGWRMSAPAFTYRSTLCLSGRWSEAHVFDHRARRCRCGQFDRESAERPREPRGSSVDCVPN